MSNWRQTVWSSAMMSSTVLSALSLRPVLIPCSSSVLTTSTLPQSATACRAVPREERMLMSIPILRSFITTLRWPFLKDEQLSSSVVFPRFVPHLLARCTSQPSRGESPATGSQCPGQKCHDKITKCSHCWCCVTWRPRRPGPSPP